MRKIGYKLGCSNDRVGSGFGHGRGHCGGK